MHSTALLIGLLVTLVLSGFSHRFLNWTVKAGLDLAPKFSYLRNVRGGGWYLGFFESVLFFTAFWSADYLIVGGAWLTFKLGAKWASWQHVIKMPEHKVEDNIHEDLEWRLKFGSMQLGRFLNGTMYSGFCGAFGCIVAKVIISRAWIESLLLF